MISYKPTTVPNRETVYLDGKRVGEIAPSIAGGFRYRTTTGNLGAVFPTVAEVKRSLESGY